MFGIDADEVPQLTTLPMDQASDFMTNMALAAKDGTLKDWVETISIDHLEKVAATVKDMEVCTVSYTLPTPAMAEAVSCFMRHVAACERDGKPISEAVICAPCAMRLSEGLGAAQDYLASNATPQIQKLIDYVDDLKKQALAQRPEMLEQMAQMMASEMGLDIKEARAQVGLSEDGKTLLNQQGETTEEDTETGEKPGGWSTPSL